MVAAAAAASLLTLGLVLPRRAPPAAQPSPAATMMAGAAAQQVDGVRVGPPPDLPSLLLNNRIVYIGMPLAPSVTELVVAELLFLNYDNPEKNVFMYINSPGTSSNDRQVTSFETEAFAISDTMTYIAPEVETICLGTAFGTAAMLWVGGHILLVGADELGWHFPYDAVHSAEYAIKDAPLGGFLGWCLNTVVSAIVGFWWGLMIVGVVGSLPAADGEHADDTDAPASHH